MPKMMLSTWNFMHETSNVFGVSSPRLLGHASGATPSPLMTPTWIIMARPMPISRARRGRRCKGHFESGWKAIGKVDVDIRHYLYYAECLYIANMYDLPTEQLASCRGRTMVHPDSLCWENVILHSSVRYLDRLKSVYFSKEEHRKRFTLSALGRLVQYDISCCYNLRETACDRLFVRTPPSFERLYVCRRFLFEQRTIL